MRVGLNRILILIISVYLSHSQSAHAAETCSRTAIVNYQEVLVDTNSAQKGDGLRFYLEKDQQAYENLQKYQKGTRGNWINAGLGTAGTLMLLAGSLATESDSGKRSLFVAGASVIILNFLVAKTLEHQNEKYLHRAIEEYNARNLPRIYFSPGSGGSKGETGGSKVQLNYNLNF